MSVRLHIGWLKIQTHQKTKTKHTTYYMLLYFQPPIQLNSVNLLDEKQEI